MLIGWSRVQHSHSGANSTTAPPLRTKASLKTVAIESKRKLKLRKKKKKKNILTPQKHAIYYSQALNNWKNIEKPSERIQTIWTTAGKIWQNHLGPRLLLLALLVFQGHPEAFARTCSAYQSSASVVSGRRLHYTIHNIHNIHTELLLTATKCVNLGTTANLATVCVA